MRVLIVKTQVKPEYREQFIAASLGDAQGSVENEPGCLRFDVIQDEEDPNVIYFYEVYRDQAALDAHVQYPHYVKWRDTVKDWRAAPGRVERGFSVYPPDDAWRKQGQ